MPFSKSRHRGAEPPHQGSLESNKTPDGEGQNRQSCPEPTMNGDDNIVNASSKNRGRVSGPGKSLRWASANFFTNDSPVPARSSYGLMNRSDTGSGSARMLQWRPGTLDRTSKARLFRSGRAPLLGIEALMSRRARGTRSRHPMSRGSYRDLPIWDESPGRKSYSPGGLHCSSNEAHKG